MGRQINQLKNRIFAILMGMVMVLAVFPMGIFAGEDNLPSGEEAPPASEPIVIETKVFTDAGPFMPPVKVPRKSKLMASGTPDPYDPDENGLSMNKTVTKNDDGTFRVRLEAWSTGEVRTETVTTPVDIVIVLDQSESMGYNFAGDENTGWPYYANIPEANTRQYAMKNAVKSFVDQVAEKYSETGSDHRMAVVTFGNSASTLIGWTNIDSSGEAAVKNAVSGLPTYPTAATSNTGDGMALAESLISGSGYSYSGPNSTRNKVVIVFTDGVPGSSSLDSAEANEALSSSYNMKNSGVTVYSVGIFNGADPNQLYGDRWEYTAFADIPCTGEVGSYWGGSLVSSLIGQNDFDAVDIAAGNRFLNYLSGNFMYADEIGVTRGTYNPGNHSIGFPFPLPVTGTGYRIDKNFGRDTSGYYLTANDSSSLANIFDAINTNIENPKIELDADAEIQEVLSQYFTVSDGVSGVSVKTSAYNGTSFSTTETAFGDASVSISDGVLNVSGFDYATNFVSDSVKSDGTYGKKLIIEFNVTPDPNLLGGNDIPIDLDTSGVYALKDGEITRVEAIPVSSGNVDIRSFEAADRTLHVYYGTELSNDDIAASVSTSDVDLDSTDLIRTFVDIEKTVTDAGDGTYSVDIEVSAKTNGSHSAGTPATAKEDSADVTVYEYTPEVCFKDVKGYLGKSISTGIGSLTIGGTDYSAGDVIDGNVIWKCEATGNTDTTSGTEMYTDAPEVNFAFAPEKTGTIDSLADIGVDVTITGSIEGGSPIDYSAVAKVTHKDCTGTDDSALGNHEFLIHVIPYELTVVHSGTKTGEEDQTFVYRITNGDDIDMEVVIRGDGSTTVTNLPAGTYTVEAEGGWSWRYILGDDSISKTLSETVSNNVFTFTDTRSEKSTDASGNGWKWLNGVDSALNVFNSAGGGI